MPKIGLGVEHHKYRTTRLKWWIRTISSPRAINLVQGALVRICKRPHRDMHEVYVVNLFGIRIAFWFNDSGMEIGSGEPHNLEPYRNP
jgi:hypothetical protein